MCAIVPIGPITLTILLVLISFGLAEQALGRLRVTRRQALLLVGAMLAGSLFDLDLAPGLSINLGGGVLPCVVAAGLFATAERPYESARALTATLVTAGAVYLVGRLFPPGEPTELNLFYLDAQYLYGVTAGLVGFTAGRSHRTAFAAAVLGVILADLTHYIGYIREGAERGLFVHAGGGGFWGTAMVAGVLAVLTAEIIGETGQVLKAGQVGRDE
ncbi:MAG TPA: DUF1614 domain-containing protein [Symbiobacteriaceae bacterium]|nr:DUF1614 domain-containing protein [Symbiobacteriaceae bacterium]